MTSRQIRVAMTQTKNVAPLPGPEKTLTREVIEAIKEKNLDHHAQLIHQAKAEGAQMIGLNELFAAPYFAIKKERDPLWLTAAESAENGPTTQALLALSKALEMVILAPIYEKLDGSDEYYNTTVVMDKGEFIGKYRKTHIPHGENELGNFTEGFYYKASDDSQQNAGAKKVKGHPLFPVFETHLGKVGIATCFDRHFFYVWRQLKKAGAEFVFSPAVTFGAVSQSAWKHEFPTEAVRNGLFIGGSNKEGQEFEDGPTFFGDSYFVGPDGKRLKNMSSHQELVIADLDLDQLKKDASGWNLAKNEREI